MRNGWVSGLLVLVSLGTWAADERVVVSYDNIEAFSDFGESRWDRERNQKDFSALLQEVTANLPPGQLLAIKVLDVNRAGELEWLRTRAERLRVMRNVSWPRIEFEYQISEGGRVLKAGTARLADMGYLQDGFFTHAQSNNQSWRYERRLLDRWFKETVLAPAQGK